MNADNVYYSAFWGRFEGHFLGAFHGNSNVEN